MGLRVCVGGRRGYRGVVAEFLFVWRERANASLPDQGHLCRDRAAADQYASAISEQVLRYMQAMKQRKGLPGTSSSRMNEIIRSVWDWRAAREQWTPSEDWKRSLISCVLERYIPTGSEILEIGRDW
jgi:hypothetical protein